ncbi:hypothetical protein CW304_32305 [Bacillus sp. UFRGS-B20]|nr:hypothetical protein CW304_32305 [Bacillus sp. UFRGS-B20]
MWFHFLVFTAKRIFEYFVRKLWYTLKHNDITCLGIISFAMDAAKCVFHSPVLPQIMKEIPRSIS